MTNKLDEKTEYECILVAACGYTLNGYSKSFRQIMYNNNDQNTRIDLMEMLIEEIDLMGSLEEIPDFLIEKINEFKNKKYKEHKK